MSFIQILIGVVAMVGIAGFLMAALRPGRIGRSFTDVDKDGEPDATREEKQATIDEDRAHQRELHGGDNP